MIKGNAKLIIDFGNSETRGLVRFGKSERVVIASNRFGHVGDEDYKLSDDYSSVLSTVFEIKGKVDGKDVGGVFCHGEVQEREFSVAPIRPYAITKKAGALTTLLSYNVMLWKGLNVLKAMTQQKSVVDVAEVEWDIVALLPPGQYEADKELLQELLLSVRELNLHFPKIHVPVKVSSATVLPEGFCAYIGTIFDKKSEIRPEYRDILNETTLVLDVGAGTSDMIIIEDKRILQYTKNTINRGGNNVTQLVKKKLKAQGLFLPEVKIIEGIAKGKVKDGAKWVDIREEINASKSEIALFLIKDVMDFFEESQFPVRTISRMLVVGGGILAGEGVEGLIPLTDTLVTQVKKYAPNIELIEIPEIEISEEGLDGSSVSYMSKIHVRLLNLMGAGVLTK